MVHCGGERSKRVRAGNRQDKAAHPVLTAIGFSQPAMPGAVGDAYANLSPENRPDGFALVYPLSPLGCLPLEENIVSPVDLSRSDDLLSQSRSEGPLHPLEDELLEQFAELFVV